VLQCVAVCCSVLQCVAVCCRLSFEAHVHRWALKRALRVAVVLQCMKRAVSVARVLQCVAVCCSVLQCVFWGTCTSLGTLWVPNTVGRHLSRVCGITTVLRENSIGVMSIIYIYICRHLSWVWGITTVLRENSHRRDDNYRTFNGSFDLWASLHSPFRRHPTVSARTNCVVACIHLYIYNICLTWIILWGDYD